MPDIINSSFDPRLPFPLDVRQQVQDMNALYAIPNTSRWEGMLVYVRSSETLYILKGGIDNSFWLALQFNGGGGLLPNGIVIYGEAQQSGNDILLNDAWVWRIDQVDYQSSDDVISITPAAAGNLRVDIIVGDNLGNFVKVVGTEVASPGPAIEPNIPADTVPLLRVDVNDTGITAITEFILSAFVRYDINDQGLTPTFRQNARTNIQAISKDTDDTKTGKLGIGVTSGQLDTNSLIVKSQTINQNEFFTLLYEDDSVAVQQFNDGRFVIKNKSGSARQALDVDGSIGNSNAANFKGLGPTIASGRAVVEIINTTGDRRTLGIKDGSNVENISLYSGGTIFHGRSDDSTKSIRRDENYLTYPVTISGTGKLNDVALANGVGAIKFSSGVTEVSGIDPSGDTKELLIWSDNPDGITLPAEDVLSIAANRFFREVNVPYQTWVRVVYEASLSRWVNANTGELQETDARYFEVTDDVLTLKYILPDIAALQAFVRGPAVIAEVSDPLRGGKFNYVAEGDFVGSPDNGISFLAQDGGYWVRDFSGDVDVRWYGENVGTGGDDTLAIIAAFKGTEYAKTLKFPKGTYTFNKDTVPVEDIITDFYGDFVKCSSINGNNSTIIIDGLIGFDTSDVVDLEIIDLKINSKNGYGTDTTSGDINAVFYQMSDLTSKSRKYSNINFVGDVLNTNGSQKYGECIIEHCNTKGLFENIYSENYKVTVRVLTGQNFRINNITALNSQTTIFTSDDCSDYDVHNVTMENTFDQSQIWLGKNHPTDPKGINGLDLFLGGGDNYSLFNLNAINPSERCIYSQGGNVMANKLRCVNGTGFKFVGVSALDIKKNIKVSDTLLLIDRDITVESIQPTVSHSAIYWVENISFSNCRIIATENVTGNPVFFCFSLSLTSKNVTIEDAHCSANVAESFLYPVFRSESGLPAADYVVSENVTLNNCSVNKNLQKAGSLIGHRRNEASADALANYLLKNVSVTNCDVFYGAAVDNFWYEYANTDGFFAQNNKANKQCAQQSGIPLSSQLVTNNVVLKEKNIRFSTLSVLLSHIRLLMVSRATDLHFITDFSNRTVEFSMYVFDVADKSSVIGFNFSNVTIKFFVNDEYYDYTGLPSDYSIIVDSTDGYYIGKTNGTTRTDLLGTSAVTITQPVSGQIVIRGDLYAKKALITLNSTVTP